VINGLHEVVIKWGRIRQAFLAGAGDRDENARGEGGDASKLRRHFNPADSGQREIQEHDIRPMERRRLDRRRAIEAVRVS
jgi:hypothetical protein